MISNKKGSLNELFQKKTDSNQKKPKKYSLLSEDLDRYSRTDGFESKDIELIILDFENYFLKVQKSIFEAYSLLEGDSLNDRIQIFRKLIDEKYKEQIPEMHKFKNRLAKMILEIGQIAHNEKNDIYKLKDILGDLKICMNEVNKLKAKNQLKI